MDNQAIQTLVNTAIINGVPKDQLENFNNANYIPLPWQMRFHSVARQADKPNGPVEIACGGARGPGKSHSVFAQITLDDCQRIPNLKGLFLRQTGAAAKESFEDLIFKVLSGNVKYKYRAMPGSVTFDNGSKIILGGFKDDKDIDNYIGIEYDLMAVEELNQLTKEKVQKLKGSLRSAKENWRPRFYSSFNPGGIGHLFVKTRYVDPHNENRETRTRFVPSTYKQNPYLNVEYIDYLKGLEGPLGKAWREGSFDMFEGQYFDEWDYHKHTIRPFEIPETWKRFRAYDHGRDAPACCKWYAVDNDGRVWVYREFYQSGLNVPDIASKINELSGDEQYQFSVADPSIFARHGFVDQSGGQTIAETFARYGIMWLPASNRRVDGWNLMHQYLAWTEYTKPKMIYFNTCVDSIRTIPSLIHDKLHPEDLDSKTEDHSADTDRYFLSALHEQKTPIPDNEVQKKLKQMQKASSINPLKLNEFYRL
jgi:PBSX family phage terminase large subunit